jgi:hypothetical protein
VTIAGEDTRRDVASYLVHGSQVLYAEHAVLTWSWHGEEFEVTGSWLHSVRDAAGGGVGCEPHRPAEVIEEWLRGALIGGGIRQSPANRFNGLRLGEGTGSFDSIVRSEAAPTAARSPLC